MNKEDVNLTDHEGDVQLIFITQKVISSRHDGTLTTLTVSVVVFSDVVTSEHETNGH
jgi:hypothetical protein